MLTFYWLDFTTKDHPGLYSLVLYTSWCNFRCYGCHNRTLAGWDYNNKELSEDKIRGLSEKPGAFFIYNDKKIKAIKADNTTDKSTRKPGTVVKIIKNYGIRVATGTNDIILTKLQPAGKKIMNAYAFYIGARFKENTVFY